MHRSPRKMKELARWNWLTALESPENIDLAEVRETISFSDSLGGEATID